MMLVRNVSCLLENDGIRRVVLIARVKAKKHSMGRKNGTLFYKYSRPHGQAVFLVLISVADFLSI